MDPPTAAQRLHVLYFVHDVADPAVRRRVLMLQAGGAKVTLTGFRRDGKATPEIAGIRVVELGVTHDARLAHRAASVLRAVGSVGTKLRGVARPDMILARNLEMLAVAKAARKGLGGAGIPVIYECLDIHRLILRRDPLGGMLRGLERSLARDAALLVVSSPGFVRNYFEPFGTVAAAAELVENKHLELDDDVQAAATLPADPPWTIGWFGALRCGHSLRTLAAFTRRTEGRFRVVLRGKPALAAIPDFHAIVDAEPFLSFHGGYRNPEDIRAIYEAVHFSWVIDLFEKGQNSEWLLPNRLYEGCRFGAVPIAVAGTETGRLLAARGLGVRLPDASLDALGALDGLAADAVASLQADVRASPPGLWRHDRADCVALVDRLSRLAPARTAAQRRILAEAAS